MLELASVLAVPGGQARLLDGNNAVGWCSVDEAVARDADFCIELRSDVLVADSDVVDNPSVWSVVALAGEWNVRAFVEESGTPGHHHVWMIGVDGEAADYLVELAGRLPGIDVRHGTARCRPPGVRSSKPGASRSRLLNPVGFTEAVLALGPAPVAHLTPPHKPKLAADRRELPARPYRPHLDPSIQRAAELLATGDEAGVLRLCPRWGRDGIVYRHYADLGIALGAVNAGWEYGRYREHRLNPLTRSPRTVGVSDETVEAYLRERWDTAVDRYLTHPPKGPSSSVKAALERYVAAVHASSAFGRRRAGVHRLVDVLVEKASSLNRLEIDYAEADLELVMNGDRKTIRGYRDLLIGANFVRTQRSGSSSKATRWILVVPEDSETPPIRPVQLSLGGPESCGGDSRTPPVPRVHPVWGAGGLPGSARETYYAYGYEPISKAEAGRRGAGKGVYEGTPLLLDVGFIHEEPPKAKRYAWSTDADPDAVAERGGESGAAGRLRARQGRVAIRRFLHTQAVVRSLQARLEGVWVGAHGDGEHPLKAVDPDVVVDTTTGEKLTPAAAYSRLWNYARSGPTNAPLDEVGGAVTLNLSRFPAISMVLNRTDQPEQQEAVA